MGSLAQLSMRWISIGLVAIVSVASLVRDCRARGPELPALMVASSKAYPPGTLVPGYERLPYLAASLFARGARAPISGALRWLSVGGRVLAPGEGVPRGGVRIFPSEPGETAIRLRSGLRRISVVSVHALGAREDGLFEREILALSRDLPPELALSSPTLPSEPEAVVFLVKGPPAAIPATLTFVSTNWSGRYIDALRDVGLVSAKCTPNSRGGNQTTSFACGKTVPIRLAADPVERNHPATQGRTVVAEVGGGVLVRVGDDATRRIPVGASSAIEPNGPGRYRVQVRARIVRTFEGGPPAVGADEEDAKRIVLDEIHSASRMWGQCGIHLGVREQIDVEVVDPPDITLLTVGCRRGLAASGGNIDLKVGGRRVFVRTTLGQTPRAVSGRLALAIRKTGHRVRHYRNALVEHEALPTFDLLITDKEGAPVRVEPTRGEELTNDPSLGLCNNQLDLADGLEHFNDLNAASGTAEERMILRGLQDEDPSTIDLIVVPGFSGVGRIGESFIHSPGSSIRNALILDRTGLRAGARSFTLAHELGHVLLQLPGHPDDFGVDTPTSLMDSDAADSTIFGPRRLTLSDCQRALRQSGRNSPTPLVFDWPLP